MTKEQRLLIINDSIKRIFAKPSWLISDDELETFEGESTQFEYDFEEIKELDF